MEKGIKETKEALKGINELSLCLIKSFKDGVQTSDFMELFVKLQTDEDFKKALTDAADGIKEVPAEISDISMAEGVELAMVQIQYLPKLIEAFK